MELKMTGRIFRRCCAVTIFAVLSLCIPPVLWAGQGAWAFKGENFYERIPTPQRTAWIWLEKGDYERALRFFVPRAVAGDPIAEFALGYMYSRGKGLPEDSCIGTVWFGRAAMGGFPQAMLYFGLSHMWGNGVRQDYGTAFQWLLEVERFDPELPAGMLEFSASQLSEETKMKLRAEVMSGEFRKNFKPDYIILPGPLLDRATPEGEALADKYDLVACYWE